MLPEHMLPTLHQERFTRFRETQMTGAITKLASLVDQVKSATTVSGVQAIVW